MHKLLVGVAEVLIFIGFCLLVAATVEAHDFLYGRHAPKELVDALWWALLAAGCAVLPLRLHRF